MISDLTFWILAGLVLIWVGVRFAWMLWRLHRWEMRVASMHQRYATSWLPESAACTPGMMDFYALKANLSCFVKAWDWSDEPLIHDRAAYKKIRSYERRSTYCIN